MKNGEGLKISLRSIRRRPVESMLLILGIALGVGATAAGISMISSSIEEKNLVLGSTQYREITVQVREDADDMELPFIQKVSGEDVILSWADLSAKTEVPDIQFAYLADETQFRIGNFNIAGRPGADQPNATDGESPAQPAVKAPVTDGPQPVMNELSGMRVSP
ncbi:MAG: hypothetical protein HN368_22205 [Spirochaetales bacterium]|nr:hypothetical protein [Spirochaetales bacterium]